ncbi:hypothetical protein [uncultured Clostridium sp.]|uniref:hypothetical protein n=1 Tax=uncultured Clostridium sp. TaxID=59620 RepID=UPI0028E72199|nr:hypothetical protein [uncultured Clostridium sp.]
MDKLINMSEVKKNFYIASMLLTREQNTNDEIALAKLTGKLANPFSKRSKE